MNKQQLLENIKNEVPTVIKFSQLDLVPSRADFLNPQLTAAVSAAVNCNKPILFMPNDVQERSEYLSDEYGESYSVYRPYIFGILPDGSKTCIILEDIEVYFMVKIPDNVTPDDFITFARTLLQREECSYNTIDVAQYYPFHGFTITKVNWIKITFNNIWDRKRAMSAVIKGAAKYKPVLAYDDDSSYFNMVARTSKFSTADWNRIEQYYLCRDYKTRGKVTDCAYVFRVKVADYVKLKSARRKEIEANKTSPLAAVIEKDLIIQQCWDIETHRSIESGEVPTPADTDWSLIMIHSEFSFHHSMKSFYSVNITAAPQKSKKVPLTIICETQSEILIAWLEISRRMKTDILCAFNGANFDWPLVREALYREKLLARTKQAFGCIELNKYGRYQDTEENIKTRDFKEEKVKIDAETRHTCHVVAKFSGCIDTDAAPIFRQLYPRSEVGAKYSLNFYLSLNKLGSKTDMYYKLMFRIFEASLALRDGAEELFVAAVRIMLRNWRRNVEEILLEEDIPHITTAVKERTVDYIIDWPQELRVEAFHILMGAVGYYCKVDSHKIQELLAIRSILKEKRELAALTHTIILDSYFRANGSKVRNIIGYYAHRWQIAFSNGRVDKHETEKMCYGGGLVINPKKGLNNKKPVTGLDFSSLYPSLMITYNLSPDMIVKCPKKAQELRDAGYTLHHIKPFTYKMHDKTCQCHPEVHTIEGWTVRHNGITNNPETAKVDIPRIIDHYEKKVTYEWKENDETKKIEEVYDLSTGLNNKLPIHNVREIPAAAGPNYKRSVKVEAVNGRERLPGERIGICSFVVKKLFDKRVPIKKEFVRLSEIIEEMEKNGLTEKDGIKLEDYIFRKNAADQKQKAIKVVANTFYGESGNFRSPVFELLMAGGITSAGRESLQTVHKYVSDVGYEAYYGDSVTAGTAVIVKSDNDKIIICAVDKLREKFTWLPEWKPFGNDKEQIECNKNLWSWSEKGWTRIRRIIRHRYRGTIYRIFTKNSMVEVTRDHSMLDALGDVISPADITPGYQLLQKDYPRPRVLCCETSDVEDILNFSRPEAVAIDFAARYPSPIGITDQTVAAKICAMLTKGGYEISVGYSRDNDKIIAVSYSKNAAAAGQNEVTAKIGRNADEVVYDLETENSHFAAGVGRLVVHNTDSVYVGPPDDRFAECMKQFEEGLIDIIELWTKKVQITMKDISILREELNDYLITVSNSLALNTAYEEVLYPYASCGKKKYYGVQHIKSINFFPKDKDYFIRGLNIVKQGQAPICKELAMDYLKQSLSPYNKYTMMELLDRTIEKYCVEQWDTDKFIIKAKFKPEKRNVPVHTFVERMKRQKDLLLSSGTNDAAVSAALYEPPEAGDPFDYVIVESEQQFTSRGTKIKTAKGDKMEYYKVYLESQKSAAPLNIDYEYYMESYIASTLARYVSHEDQFQPPDADQLDLDIPSVYKSYDEKCAKNAAEYVMQKYYEYSGKIPRKERAAADTVVGRQYRAIHKNVEKIVKSTMATKYGSCGVLSMLEGSDTSVVAGMLELAATYSVDKEYGAQYLALMRGHQISIYDLKTMFSPHSRTNATLRTFAESKINRAREELFKHVPVLREFVANQRRQHDAINSVLRISTGEEFNKILNGAAELGNLTEIEQESLDCVNKMMLQAAAGYKFMSGLTSIYAAINAEIAATGKFRQDPERSDISKLVDDIVAGVDHSKLDQE